VLLSGDTTGWDSAPGLFDASATNPLDTDRLPELLCATPRGNETTYPASSQNDETGPQSSMSSKDDQPLRIDVETINRLAVIERSRPGFLPRLVESFGGNQRRFIAGIDASLAADDRASLRIGAHTLKGSAASLGAVHLAQLAGDLESIAMSAPPAAIAEAASRLRAEFEPSLTSLVEACSRVAGDNRDGS
jgi:HPt (histidine-containing phosphotransfer) domain-containing protein